jgi:hypothetical protein
MTDNSHSIGQDAKGVIGYNVIGNTIIHEQKLLITPEAIELNPFQARSPYKALKRFDVDDREYFFGRYQFVLELQAAIQDSNLILVLGSSGSGKSSVVRARLIPEFLGTNCAGNEGGFFRAVQSLSSVWTNCAAADPSCNGYA